MAIRVRTEIVDDLTGEPGATTFFFALGSDAYEIDLVSMTPLSEALAPFIKVARKASRRRTNIPDTTANVDNAEIRKWATDNDLFVPKRGRIPDAIRKAYAARDPRLASTRAAS